MHRTEPCDYPLSTFSTLRIGMGLIALGAVFFPIDIPAELAGIVYPDVYTNRPLHLLFATAFFLLIAYACLRESSASTSGDRTTRSPEQICTMLKPTTTNLL